jgi:probable HAF family extracellular repeat protein
MVDLGTIRGGFESYAAGVNDAGVVAGDSFTETWDYHAFRWENGVMTDLGTLGGTYSDSVVVNAMGWVVGVSTTVGDAEQHGFVWHDGAMHDLGTLGGTYSSVSAVNAHGQVVGDSVNAAGDVHAFMWQNGVMTDLNSLLPANSGWVLESASFVNDVGQVVGVGTWNGQSAWFVLSPSAPAPSNHPPVARPGRTSPWNATLRSNSTAAPRVIRMATC